MKKRPAGRRCPTGRRHSHTKLMPLRAIACAAGSAASRFTVDTPAASASLTNSLHGPLLHWDDNDISQSPRPLFLSKGFARRSRDVSVDEGARAGEDCSPVSLREAHQCVPVPARAPREHSKDFKDPKLGCPCNCKRRAHVHATRNRVAATGKIPGKADMTR